MASLAPPGAPLVDSEKHKDDGVIFLERHPTNVDSEMAKPIPQVGRTDYSGAHEKTDPKEIALVKKLDRWIMPMLWSMYWLNYLDRNAIALARLNDLEDDLGLSSTRKSIQPSLMLKDVTDAMNELADSNVLQNIRPASAFCSLATCWVASQGKQPRLGNTSNSDERTVTCF